ncbi:MAG: hypothetical protein ACI4TU_05800 [Candidatus Cryptobacteroides sp.]
MKLPRFVILSNPDENIGNLVMETKPPFFLGKVYSIPKKEEDAVEQMMADLANDRITAIKLPGYTIFLVASGTMAGGTLDPEQAKPLLREMGDFYKAAVIERKRGKYRKFQEGVPDNLDQLNGRRIKEAKAEGRKIFLDQK